MTPSFMSSSQRPRSRFRSSACCYRLDRSKLRWLRISICEIGATTQADRAMSSAMWLIAIVAAFSHVRIVPQATWAGATSLRMRAPPRVVFDRVDSATSALKATPDSDAAVPCAVLAALVMRVLRRPPRRSSLRRRVATRRTAVAHGVAAPALRSLAWGGWTLQRGRPNT